jgi:hypothetical protein
LLVLLVELLSAAKPPIGEPAGELLDLAARTAL